ncbi:MAG: ComF family protein [Fibrobacteria bacterium]|nr:ComF family protein [Fibrobacteria bacterium]
MRSLARWSLDLLAPRVCAGCGGLARDRAALCTVCRDDGFRAPLVRPDAVEGISEILAGTLLEGGARHLIHDLKYRGSKVAAFDLAEWIARLAPPETGPEVVLVPVPLTAARRRERGYNQAELLARELSKRWGIRVEPAFLSRKTFRGSQTRRGGEDRRRALAATFVPGPRFSASSIPVLVDDVLTTGATLSACAAACLHGGVDRVHGVCAAWAQQEGGVLPEPRALGISRG